MPINFGNAPVVSRIIKPGVKSGEFVYHGAFAKKNTLPDPGAVWSIRPEDFVGGIEVQDAIAFDGNNTILSRVTDMDDSVMDSIAQRLLAQLAHRFTPEIPDAICRYCCTANLRASIWCAACGGEIIRKNAP